MRTRRGHGRLNSGRAPLATACAAAVLGWPAGDLHAAEAPAADSHRGLQEVAEVVVTASRIRRENVVMPTPVMSLTAEDFLMSGATDVASFVNESPAFLAGVSPAANDSSGGAGSAFLDLRALGPKRTLVLVNGRRHAPTSVGGSVDVSVLPSVALERIETVTGGASAAWGSDAVAGVVNVIYAKDLQGVRATAQYGAAEQGDAGDTRIAFAAGDDFFAGRGHVLIAAEYQKSSGIADQKDRDWGARRWGVIRNPADTGPSDGIPARLIRPDANLTIATEGGLIIGPGPVANLQFTPGGGVAPFERGSIVAPPYMIGGDGANFGQYAALLQPYERKNAFMSADLDLTDDVRVFFEGGYALTDAHSDVVQSFVLGNLVVRADNAFLPGELRTLLQDNHVPAFAMGRLNTDMGFIRTNREQRMRRAVLGLAGEFGAAWSWETYVQYGEADSTERLSNNFMPTRFAFAADAVRDANGQIVCRATLNPLTAAAAQGCQPINLFGFGSPSATAIDYVSGTSFFAQEQSQAVGSAEIRGQPWELWAGPLSIAAGVEYRREQYTGAGDEATAAGEFLLGTGQALTGEFSVKETFAEILLPVLTQQSFARSLELSAAARLTDYDTIGSVETWKLGFVWDTAHSVTFRGSLSQDIRAPNIAELFAPEGVSFFTPVDPCDAASQAANPAYAQSCAAAGLPADFAASNGLIRVLTGGNPNLNEETARTRTAGLIIAPPAIPGLNLSLDWYDIRIADAILLGVPVPTILDGCYGGSYPNSYCDGVQRDATGQLASITSSGLNVAEFRNRGVDWQARYGFSAPALFESGDANIAVSVLGGYLIEQSDTRALERIDRAGELRRDNSGLPKLRWNANVSYATDRVGLSGQVRYIGSGKYDNTYGPEDIEDNSIAAEWYLDLSARVPLQLGAGSLEFFAGVNNVFDNDPAIVPYEFAISALATNPGLYDTIGRYFYGGVRISL
jgi:iron complex outermembrane receptor protein